ncbi:unnamed protein product, partial [Adineta ricciae]
MTRALLFFYLMTLALRFSKSINNYAAVNTFYPFLSQDGADPWVYKHPTNGFYYATKSTQTNVT